MSDSVPGGYKASDGRWYSADGRHVWEGEQWVARAEPVPKTATTASEAPKPNPARSRRKWIYGAVGLAALYGLLVLASRGGGDENDGTAIDNSAGAGTVQEMQELDCPDEVSRSDLFDEIEAELKRFPPNYKPTVSEVNADLGSLACQTAVRLRADQSHSSTDDLQRMHTAVTEATDCLSTAEFDEGKGASSARQYMERECPSSLLTLPEVLYSAAEAVSAFR